MSHPAFVIGDIHGNADLLQILIRKARGRFGSDVALYHVGDLVDRGHASKAVIQMCIDEDIQGILGNHETWMHQVFATGHFDPFALHPVMKGDLTLRSYGIEPECLPPEVIATRMLEEIPESHQNYILSLPITRSLTVKGKVYRLTHGGLKESSARQYWAAATAKARAPGITVEDALMGIVGQKSPEMLLWAGTSWSAPTFWEFQDGSVQVFGHTPAPRGQPLVTPHWIAIDGGCSTLREVLGGIELASLETLTVNRLSGKGFGSGGFLDFTL